MSEKCILIVYAVYFSFRLWYYINNNCYFRRPSMFREYSCKRYTPLKLCAILLIIFLIACLLIPLIIHATNVAREKACSRNMHMLANDYRLNYSALVSHTQFVHRQDCIEIIKNILSAAGEDSNCPSSHTQYEYKLKDNLDLSIYCKLHKKRELVKNYQLSTSTPSVALDQLAIAYPEFVAHLNCIEDMSMSYDKDLFLTVKKNGTSINAIDALLEYFGYIHSHPRYQYDSAYITVAANSTPNKIIIASIAYTSGNCGYIRYTNGHKYELDKSVDSQSQEKQKHIWEQLVHNEEYLLALMKENSVLIRKID